MKKITFFIMMLILFNIPLFSQEVSPSGAFTYSVPIEVPPGTNGMQPNLALVYNSQAGNGMLGMGWNLSGLSIISRDSSYDLDFDDSTDHFILDGQRLIKDDSGLYHTQVENYSIIEFNNPGINSSWTVSTKAGLKMYYGATADSRIEAVGKNGEALMWRLNKVEDVLGNYMTVEYTEDEVNGDSYPIKIEYTMNESHTLNKTRRVEFLYEERDDHFVQYVPTAIDMDYRLKWVVVKIGGNLLRKYGLDYESVSTVHTSRLINFTEYGNDGNTPSSSIESWVVDESYVSTGKSLPSIKFNWTDSGSPLTNYNSTYKIYSLYNENAATWYTGDFNGDGQQDVISIYKYSNELSRIFGFFGTIDGLTGYNELITLPSWNRDASIWIPGDFNGDGKTDLLSIYNYSGNDTIKYFMGCSSGLSWSSHDVLIPFEGASALWKIGDFNNDGFQDLIAIRKLNYNVQIIGYLGSENGLMNGVEWNYLSQWNRDAAEWQVGDFNGDGNTDLLAIYNYGSGNDKILHLWGTENGFSVSSYNKSLNFERNEADWYVVDHNSDGIADLLAVRKVNNSNTKIYGYWGSVNGITGGGEWNNLTYFNRDAANWIMGDFTGDGITDLIAIYDYSSNDAILGFIGNGHGLTGYSNWKSFSGYEWKESTWKVGDFNGNGQDELYSFRNETTYDLKIGLFQNPTIHIKPHQITDIKNNQGGQINIQYTPAPQIPGAIAPESCNYPVVPNKSPTSLVTKVSYSNGMGSTSSTSYEYHNGKYITGIPTERKSLGFEWTKTINDATGAYTKTWYYQEEQEALFAGMVKRRENYGSDGLLYTAVENIYANRAETEATSDYHAVNYIWMSDTYNYNYNGDNSSDPIITWKHIDEPDALGNITRSVDYGECQYNSFNQESIEDAYEYDNFIKEIQYAPPIDNRTVPVKEIQKEYGLDQFDEYSSPEFVETEIRYYYDGNEFTGYFTKGLLTKEVQENGDNDLVLTYGYDNWGNREWTKDTKFTLEALSGFTEELEFDPNYHTYLINKINAIGHTATIIYDNGENTLMRPTEKIDANGVSSIIKYDAFGRSIKSILPGDSETNPSSRTDYIDAAFNIDGSISQPRAIVSISKDGTNNNYSIYTYYDGLNRKIQVKTEGTNGKWHTKDLL